MSHASLKTHDSFDSICANKSLNAIALYNYDGLNSITLATTTIRTLKLYGSLAATNGIHYKVMEFAGAPDRSAVATLLRVEH